MCRTLELFLPLVWICFFYGQDSAEAGVQRIVGGTATTIKRFPYQISLQHKKFGHMCGGAIISRIWIITAAHCIHEYPAQDLLVRVGSTYQKKGGEEILVKIAIPHEKYTNKNTNYDIGLLLLKTPISAKNFRPVRLPLPGIGPPRNSKAVITGWGHVSEGGGQPDNLQMLELPVVNQNDCRKVYGEQVTDMMFCAGHLAGGKDSCQGDSGGPLVIEGTLYGIVSWGEGCARPDRLGVYTNVAALRDWITFHTEQDKSDTKLSVRIVGGTKANIADFPYQASLQDKYGHMCGASIISNTWIITAAHCVEGAHPKQIFIRVGSTDLDCEGQLLSVKTVIPHQKYNSQTVDYDIALLEMDTKISTGNTQPVKLPSPGPGPPEDAIATVTGWGYVSENGELSKGLQKVQVPLVKQEQCRSIYGAKEITDRMFCAGLPSVGGKDSCQGDSGGPLVINGTLYGVVSWGIGCARPRFPGIYTNVALLREWITSNISL